MPRRPATFGSAFAAAFTAGLRGHRVRGFGGAKVRGRTPTLSKTELRRLASKAETAPAPVWSPAADPPDRTRR